MAAPTETLSDLVERVTFHNPDNGFCVLRVKARGQRDLVTVIGHAATISAGKFISATGEWVTDREHGLQFKAAAVTTTQPTTLEGIEKYLGSGMIRGVGPACARALVQGFGEAVFDLIEQEPGRLREVAGIGQKRAARIVAGWAEQGAQRGPAGSLLLRDDARHGRHGVRRRLLLRATAGGRHRPPAGSPRALISTATGALSHHAAVSSRHTPRRW